MTLQLDQTSAARFVAALTGSAEAPVTFQTFVEGDGGSCAPPRIIHASLAAAWPQICDLQGAGHGVFIMVNEGDLQGRSSANVVSLRALFYDADVEPWPDPAKLSPPPSLVVSSGRGQHGYWLLAPGEPLADFTPAQRGIAARLGTDPKVVDASRVMRLPGTLHMKDRSQPRRVELLACEPSRRYAVIDVLAGLGAQTLRVAVTGCRMMAASSSPAAPEPEVARVLAPDARRRAEAYVAKIHAVQNDGGDSATYRAAAALLRDFSLGREDAWEVLQAWNQTNAHPPWTPHELRVKLDNAEKYATRAYGAALVAANDAIGAGWKALTPALLAQVPPRKPFIWDEAIPQGAVGTFAGPGGVGKSATMVGLAVHAALGLPFLGRATHPCQTVFFTLEDDFDDYLRKLAAWREALGELWDDDKVADNVAVVDLRGTGARLIRPTGGDYTTADEVEALADMVKARAPRAGLIVIETVSRAGGDESNPAMSALVVAAERLAQRTGAAVVLVAHVSKAAGRGAMDDQYVARGGSAIGDNGRYTITAALVPADSSDAKRIRAGSTAAEPPHTLVRLRVAKINSAPTGDIGIVEHRPSAHQTITVALVAGSDKVVGEADVRSATGARLRSLVVDLTAKGENDLTRTKLDSEHRRALAAIGITTRDMKAAIQNALDDGFLDEAARPPGARGGGLRLVPGPVVPLGTVATRAEAEVAA